MRVPALAPSEMDYQRPSYWMIPFLRA
jgi:hypothetical protein